ncbi:monovalent cation/H+ antiporter subunit D [Xanthobacteraceae bacterium Astr-EGSB]|uniref:monovalent cation/H+ antiporter subunit D n=1 Tax=Astrobacterium formosum TaxID=3069710 RepID=UPI0027B562DB|nr:monovalent cation/H+ antiporter subunit D [Xanthobacteraceae bacterium Astr-EGSB]
MSNPWLIMPLVVPALTAALLVLALRRSPSRQRVLSGASVLVQMMLAVGFCLAAADGEPRTYLLGNWPAPFGIVLVLDRLAAIMLLLTGVLAVCALLAALETWDRRGRHFHALFQFLLLGLNGAFLTGDLFNLFVFFEVLLIASYGLMLHGGGARRLKSGFMYVAVNLIGSTVFLFAVGLIYASTGTLNMADLAVKVPQVAASDQALLAAGALLLFTVFAIKSAMVPLHWWLPPAYGAAAPPVAALFAIMTKVGAYSIIRVYTLVFGADAGPLAGIAVPWILPAGILTLVLGTIGVLASRALLDLVCYALISSMGTLLIAVGLTSADGLAAALYYALQSTLVSAGLFLLAGMIGEGDERQDRGAGVRNGAGLLAGFYFVLAIAAVGMPPLAGFIGKILILEAGRAASLASAVWPAILVTSLLMIIGFARTGIRIFWNVPVGEALAVPHPVAMLPTLVVGGLIVLLVALAIFAGTVMDGLAATAEQVLKPRHYIGAVLRDQRAGPAGGE